MEAQDKRFKHNGHYISYREAQVLLACAKGWTTQEIAATLCMSYHTAKTHRENLRVRFSLQGYTGLLCFAIKWQQELEKSVTLPTKIGNVTD